MEETEISIEEVEVWVVPEEEVEKYLGQVKEEENKNNVNKEKQVDNWKVENE